MQHPRLTSWRLQGNSSRLNVFLIYELWRTRCRIMSDPTRLIVMKSKPETQKLHADSVCDPKTVWSTGDVYVRSISSLKEQPDNCNPACTFCNKEATRTTSEAGRGAQVENELSASKCRRGRTFLALDSPNARRIFANSTQS